MANKNKAIKIGIVLFLILFLLDLVSTLLHGDLIQYLEANPLYDTLGIFGIVVINFIWIFALWWYYCKTEKVGIRFAYLNALISLVLVRCFVVYNNFQSYFIWKNMVETLPAERVVEIAQNIPPETLMMAYVKVFILLVLPLVVGILTYLLFKVDHYITIKQIDPNERRKLKWKKKKKIK